MSKEKQIEEMAKIICKPTANKGNCEKCGFKKSCSKFDDATDLYNAGYRKQSEGEWTRSDEFEERYGYLYKCSACEALCFVGKYCPNCGAKMKGGAE